jgi:hypothetical protein
MKAARIRPAPAALIVLSFSTVTSTATATEMDDGEAARKATCPELDDAHKTTSATERRVVAALKESRDCTIATNVLGVASLAVLGISFFTWNDDASTDENLADLRNDLTIIKAVASERKCDLPEPDNGKN